MRRPEYDWAHGTIGQPCIKQYPKTLLVEAIARICCEPNCNRLIDIGLSFCLNHNPDPTTIIIRSGGGEPPFVKKNF